MSFFSPFADVEIPASSVYDYVLGGLEPGDLDRVALVDVASGASTSYRDMISSVGAFAGALAGHGLGAGDVVGLLAPNSSAFAIAFHGILRCGATATLINTLHTADDIAHHLRDARAATLITVVALLDKAKTAAEQAGLTDAALIVLDASGQAGCPYANFNDLISAGRPAPKLDVDSDKHVAALPYSSGTTSTPKGVMLTHQNLVANVAQIASLQRLCPDDVVIAVVPFFHIYGLTVVLNTALRARAQLVIMPKFDLEAFLTTIETYRCTSACIVPPVAVALARHPVVQDYDLTSLRTIISAAAPLDAATGDAVADRLGCRVLQAYGMTELSPASHVMPFDRGEDSIGVIAPMSSCGWTVPNSASKIVHPDTGAEISVPALGLSEAGELLFKGPNVMLGYLGKGQATSETVDPEGFLRTGDLARVDSHGCVYIVDRLKELIKYKGYQVPPAELEAVLRGHPAVADVAVIGAMEDDTQQEVPKAFVVRRSGVGLTEAEVIEYVASRVAPHKRVRQVEFVAAIPRSSTGKILRKDLRQPNRP